MVWKGPAALKVLTTATLLLLLDAVPLRPYQGHVVTGSSIESAVSEAHLSKKRALLRRDAERRNRVLPASTIQLQPVSKSSAKSSSVSNQQFSVAPAGLACASTDLAARTPAEWASNIEGSEWRLRNLVPCRSDGNASFWDLSEVSFYADDDCNGDPIPQANIRSSGTSNNWANPNAAFDNDLSTLWQGKADGDGKTGVWLWASLSHQSPVRCVKFWQCSCIYSAQMVVLERQYFQTWLPVAVTQAMTWGNWTTMKVTEPKRSNNIIVYPGTEMK